MHFDPIPIAPPLRKPRPLLQDKGEAGVCVGPPQAPYSNPGVYFRRRGEAGFSLCRYPAVHYANPGLYFRIREEAGLCVGPKHDPYANPGLYFKQHSLMMHHVITSTSNMVLWFLEANQTEGPHPQMIGQQVVLLSPEVPWDPGTLMAFLGYPRLAIEGIPFKKGTNT